MYFRAHFTRGDTFTDLYSKSIAISGTGFDPIVRRVSGSSVYVVTDASARAPQFDEADVIDGRPASLGRLEIRDSGSTNCYNGSCYTNNQTSGLVFMPLLWGTPPDDLQAGQRWTVDVKTPWEIGPAGSQAVSVVSVDPHNRLVVLQREGRGTGSSDEDKRGLTITVNGGTAHANIEGGASRWAGQMILRAGIVLSDVLLVERTITLKSELGTYVGLEREYTILSAAPAMK